MTTTNDELATVLRNAGFRPQAIPPIPCPAGTPGQEYGNKKGRDEAGERALSASIAFLLATNRIEQLTGKAPDATASVTAAVPAPQR